MSKGFHSIDSVLLIVKNRKYLWSHPFYSETLKIGCVQPSSDVVQGVKQHVREAGDIAVKSLLNRFEMDLEAVVLFGSSARGEATELSDLDFFVVVRGLPHSPLERRRLVYDALTPVTKKLRVSVGVIEVERRELGKTITPYC